MARPEDNARNHLESLLQHIGLVAEHHIQVSERETTPQSFVATVVVTLPTGEEVSAAGEESVGKAATRLSACNSMLALLRESHPQYFEPWEDLKVDAQAGDALIKLAAYLNEDLATAECASNFLQCFESNQNLASVFNLWHQAGDPFLSDWGMHLSDERKGTLVEALIWRRHGRAVVSDQLRVSLSEVFREIISHTGGSRA